MSAAGSRGCKITTSDGVRLHYLESGTGQPLLFVPGWTMPAFSWCRQLEGLADRYRVIALDPRGHGLSDQTQQNQFTERRARDLGEMIRELDLHNVVLVGWSMAVGEVLSYVDQQGSDRLAALALVDGFVKPPIEHIGGMHAFAKGFLTDRETWTTQFLEMMNSPPSSAAFRQELHAASMTVPAASAYGLLLDYFLTDNSALIRKVEVPLYVAHAPPSADQAALIKKIAPTTTVEEFSGAGHLLFYDQADKFNASLARFIERAFEK